MSVVLIRRFTRICHAVNTATKPIHRCGAEEARGAHNSEVARSKRVSGIIQFAGLQEPTTLSIQQPTTLHRHGAAAARGADNPEVTGSKPVAGILLFVCFTEARRHSYATLNTATTHYCRCSSAAERLNTRLLPFNSLGSIWGWLSAHNGEVTGSKPVAGIIPIRNVYRTLHSLRQHTHTHNPLYRGGAEGARGAHNSEVIGSNPISGIFLFACFIVLPHNPPASSWGVQKHPVTAQRR